MVTFLDIGNRIPNAPLTKLYLPTGKKIKYEYDSLNRLKEKGIVTDTAEYYSELYTYEEGGYHEESVTGVFRGPSATTIKPDRETTFVSEVIDRLVREDNAALNKTYFYEYDDFGNIEKITTYNYTAGNSLTGGVTKSYAYDSNKRLTSVTENGVTQSISGYDALGNPASYKGKTLTWTRGRMLASCGNNSYLYDMDGVRQEKTVDGVVHTYYTDGTKIIAEKVGEKVFEYYYDAQGIVAFKYDGAVYYFKKNLLGDVDRIYDANKNLVAEYKYDAWGNHRVYTGTGIDITDSSSYNNSVAKLNPFRYRGYYYDTETGLYYLNSRYYDPEIGRFISPDSIEYLASETINGLNVYAYCLNNPVMFSDSTGCASWIDNLLKALAGVAIIGALVVGSIFTGGTLSVVLAGAAIGAVAGAISSTISTAISGDWSNFGNSFLMSTAFGGVSGAIAASPLNIGWQMGLNAVLNVSSYAVTTTINGGNITLGGLLFSSATGVITGIVGGSGLMNGNTMASAAAAFGAKNFFRTIGANFWKKGFDIAVRNSINAFIIGGALNGAYSQFSYWLNPQGQFVGW